MTEADVEYHWETAVERKWTNKAKQEQRGTTDYVTWPTIQDSNEKTRKLGQVSVRSCMQRSLSEVDWVPPDNVTRPRRRLMYCTRHLNLRHQSVHDYGNLPGV